jgi:hypothetical protein
VAQGLLWLVIDDHLTPNFTGAVLNPEVIRLLNAMLCGTPHVQAIGAETLAGLAHHGKFSCIGCDETEPLTHFKLESIPNHPE